MMRNTEWRSFQDDRILYRIQSNYGIDADSGRFLITGKVDRQLPDGRWIPTFVSDSAPYIHGLIRRYFPELIPYLKWHGVGPEGPYRYLKSAHLWYRILQGKASIGDSRANPREAFEQKIVLGAFPGDELPFRLPVKSRRAPGAGPKEWSPHRNSGASWEEVQAWLEERLPKLKAEWALDMHELGVLE